ncbi:GRAM domain-containing protein 1C [Notothenia coriiceps]|uniref:GRAM domain-containing protein 1C n=1 Tax=Notothenia coriiceps TaxID=8208 RepID=A0A6I9N7Y8_9TELE|nr:PREDICTED: GRAM domain-containing protein 1C [Notothenia coriiceps]
MDQLSPRSAVGSEDVTDDSTSMLDVQWSSDEELSSSDPQSQCLPAPSPLPNYKQRLDEFKKLFRELPESERLIVDYPCALQRDILLQGRLYLAENWLCFYSNVFRGTKITLTLKDITSMTREKTARLIPNAIQVCTATDKFFFTSFSAREKSYQGVFRMWQNTLLDKPLTSLELWQMVKQHYGNDLGLSHEEMDSLHMSETSMHTSLQTARPGGDEGVGRLERPPSLRLPGMENGPYGGPPLQDELPFEPLGSQQPLNMEDARSPPLSGASGSSLDRLAHERRQALVAFSRPQRQIKQRVRAERLRKNEDVEERVVTSEVQGRLFINKVFHISANKMFELLFTDSSFFRRFMIVRKTTNSSSTAWQKDASGHMKRSLNYTISISNPLVGKFSTATENQTLYKESRDGQYYLLDSEVYTHDVPYHDYFYTQNRYYIISNSKRKCRLRVYTDVKYKKQPWGLVKSFITKNSWSGIEDYFRQLEAELLEEEVEMNQGGGDTGKIGGLRRRRRTYSRTLPEHMKPNKQYGQDPEQRRDSNMGPIEMNSPHGWSSTTLVIGMSLILLILTLMNLGLFFKLWAMEDVAHRMYLSTKHRLRERNEARLAPDYMPRQGPEYQSREDAQLLKNVLQDSINLLEQLRSSLLVLHKNFGMANRTADPE